MFDLLLTKSRPFLVALALSILAQLIGYFCKSIFLCWFSFSLWIVSIGCVVIAALQNQSQGLKAVIYEHRFILFGLSLLVIALNFSWLRSYPFSTIGDQTQDGGLKIVGLANGTDKNPFGWGTPGRNGTALLTLSVPLLKLLGPSVYVLRIPCAVYASFTVLLLYILVASRFGKWAGVWSSIILAVLPTFLFHARTDTIVATTTITTIGVLLAFAGLQSQRAERYALLGAVSGFAMNNYAPVRPVVCVAILAAFLSILANSGKLSQHVTSRIARIVSLLIGFWIGLWPLVFFGSWADAVSAPRLTVPLIAAEGAGAADTSTIPTLGGKYLTSLGAYFGAHLSRPQAVESDVPLFSLGCSLLILIGIITCLYAYRKKATIWLVIALFFVLPLTNSAITTQLNAEHRLLPAAIVASAILGVGVGFWRDRIRKYIAKTQRAQFLLDTCLAAMLMYIAFTQTLLFFNSRENTYSSFNRVAPVLDFLITQGIQEVRNDSDLKDAKELCWVFNPLFNDQIRMEHNLEQFNFYLAQTKVQLRTSDELKREEVMITPSCNPSLKYWTKDRREFCSPPKKWVCPPDGKGFAVTIAK